jgi:hypothetical protein
MKQHEFMKLFNCRINISLSMFAAWIDISAKSFTEKCLDSGIADKHHLIVNIQVSSAILITSSSSQ